jgi:hypothetical protein
LPGTPSGLVRPYPYRANFIFHNLASDRSNPILQKAVNIEQMIIYLHSQRPVALAGEISSQKTGKATTAIDFLPIAKYPIFPVTGLLYLSIKKRLSRKFRERDQGAAGIPNTRLRSKSKFARPYIWRLINFNRLTFPSVGPLFQGRDKAHSDYNGETATPNKLELNRRSTKCLRTQVKQKAQQNR